MKVILLEDVKNIGKAGEVVDVKQGYAHNFLFKKKLAAEANAQNMNVVKTQAKARQAKAAQRLADAKEMAEELKTKEFVLPVKCGDGGRLYGAVTTIDLAKELADKGYPVDKRDISFKDSIKELGNYQATLKLHPEVSLDITVQVVSKE